MTSEYLLYITIISSVAAAVCAFFPRIPAVALSFAALVCAHFASPVLVTVSDLMFWGVASAIVVGISYLRPRGLALMRKGNAYVVVGAIAGALLGVVLFPTVAAVITGSCIGAFLGTTAYMRLPHSAGLAIGSRPFMDYLGAKGLPAVVMASSAVIAVMSVI